MPKIRDLDFDYAKSSSICIKQGTKLNKLMVVHDYYHGRDDSHFLYNYIEKLLAKNIGKNVDDVFSIYCKKFPQPYIGWNSIKDAFWSYFLNDHTYWFRRDDCYYLDGKIIRKNQSKAKEYFVITDKVYETRYRLHWESWRFPEFLKLYYGKHNVPTNKAFTIDEAKEEAEKLFWFIKRYNEQHPFDKIKDYHCNSVNDIFRIYFEKFQHLASYKKIYPGTSKWYEYYNYQKQANRKKLKQIKLNEEAKIIGYEYDLWYNKRLRNRKRKEDLLEDIITRDRLGFDKDSFMGEFYHGCKRKKKSS